MLQATARIKIASTRFVPIGLILSSSSAGHKESVAAGKVGAVRSVHQTPPDPRTPTQFDNRFDNMDKAGLNPKNPTSNDKAGDAMSQSFGEGYSTRSDEEGFGGVYGGNDAQDNIDSDKFIHENHPAYDKSQGSEVKEKEKGRNARECS